MLKEREINMFWVILFPKARSELLCFPLVQLKDLTYPSLNFQSDRLPYIELTRFGPSLEVCVLNVPSSRASGNERFREFQGFVAS